MEPFTIRWPYSILVAPILTLSLILIGLWNFIGTVAVALGLLVKGCTGPLNFPLEDKHEDRKG